MTDVTPHNYEIPHGRTKIGGFLTHTKNWYEWLFKGNCPICGVKAEFSDETKI